MLFRSRISGRNGDLSHSYNFIFLVTGHELLLDHKHLGRLLHYEVLILEELELIIANKLASIVFSHLEWAICDEVLECGFLGLKPLEVSLGFLDFKFLGCAKRLLKIKPYAH